MSGNAQHDVRFGQIIQPLVVYRPYTPLQIQLARPVAAGSEFIWQAAPLYDKFFGAVLEAASGGTKRSAVRLRLPTSRRCNCLVWDPFPAYAHDLIAIRLLTTAGVVTQDISLLETDQHGPQRIFFPEAECWGAEVEIEGSVDGSNLMAVGAWQFELSYVAGYHDVEFVYTLSGSALSAATAVGDGNFTVQLNTPTNGKVTVALSTPPSGPTSVLRRMTYS